MIEALKLYREEQQKDFIMFRRLWLLAFTFALVSPALASEVVKVKGKSALIKLDNEEVLAGDQFYLINGAGKKKGIIKISKVKSDQAIGLIAAGKAEIGMTLQKRMTGSSIRESAPVASHSTTHLLNSKAYWGLSIGYGMDSMTVDLPSPASTSVSLSGGAPSLKGLFDYKLFQRLWFRGMAGYQAFSGQGSSICQNPAKTTCTVNISYLSFDFLGRYLFSEGQIRPWLGGGFALMFPLAKTATALETASISNASVFLFSGGVDWSINSNLYIPISIEYALFPKSSEVEASWIAGRIGIAWPF
jgi:hypothetical protein